MAPGFLKINNQASQASRKRVANFELFIISNFPHSQTFPTLPYLPTKLAITKYFSPPPMLRSTFIKVFALVRFKAALVSLLPPRVHSSDAHSVLSLTGIVPASGSLDCRLSRETTSESVLLFSVLAAKMRIICGAPGNFFLSCASRLASSGLDDDRDATVELRLVESEAQTQRLGEGGGEGVEVGQPAVRPHLREGDGAAAVVNRHSHPAAVYWVREAGLFAVVPGGQLLVVLLRQTPRQLQVLNIAVCFCFAFVYLFCY